MFVFLNGEFVPEESARVSLFDRSFLYGDGIFETVRVSSGMPFCFEEHLNRMEQSARFFGLGLPLATRDIQDAALRLIDRNGQLNAILRIQLSRGIGKRGFSTAGATNPILVISLHPLPFSSRLPPLDPPPRWKLSICPWQTSPDDPTLLHKTCSRAFHILARSDAEQSGADDALILNSRGDLTETTCSNIFWLRESILYTPPVDAGLLPGITRALVLRIAAKLGIETRETAAPLDALKQADTVFLTLTSWGIVEVSSIAGTAISRSPVVDRLRNAYHDRLH